MDEAAQRRKGDEATREMLDGRATYTQPAGDLETKIFLSTVKITDHLTGGDYPHSYGIGECRREPRYARQPDMCNRTMPDGRRACIRIGSSMWGEGVAGNEFEVARDEDLMAAGWKRSPDSPAVWTLGTAVMIIIIDDMLIKSPDKSFGPRAFSVLSKLAEKRGGDAIKITAEPTHWGGLAIKRKGATTTISQPVHWRNAVAKWLPELLVNPRKLPEHVPQGRTLKRALDNLKLKDMAPGERTTKEQKDAMRICGDLRWLLRTSLKITKAVHMLSCVMARPPDGAREAALGVLAEGYLSTLDGTDGQITYGTSDGRAPSPLSGTLKGSMDSARGASIATVHGEALIAQGAPPELAGASDASWSLGVIGDDDVYAYGLTHNGGVVFLELKKINLILGSSMLTEGHGMLKLSDRTLHARNLLESCGEPQTEPTLIASDNQPSLRAAGGEASVVRVKHALRWYAILQQRVRCREIRLAYIPDAWNYVDFLTKWIDVSKVAFSVAYLSNAAARLETDGSAD